MTPPLQAKLLRVAQDGRFQRIGSNAEIHVNARILAATNRNLEEEVKSRPFPRGPFLPPQRRGTERAPLARAPRRHSAAGPCNSSTGFTQGRARLSSAVTDCLERYSWPGNVRELRNAMERASLLCRGELIVPEHLPARIRPAARLRPSAWTRPPCTTWRKSNTQAVLQALRKQDFNRTATAKALGISRRALIYKLQRMRERGFDVDAP